MAGPQVRPECDYPDQIAVIFGFESGTIGTLQVSQAFAPLHFREAFGVQIQCQQGGAELRRYHNRVELSWGRLGEPLKRKTLVEDLTAVYRLELKSFANWVRYDEPPALSWREGLACLAAMEAAYRSAASNGERVTVEPAEQ